MRLQLCYECDQPTGRCDEDSLYLEPPVPTGSVYGPLCDDCFTARTTSPTSATDGKESRTTEGE